MQIFDSGFWIFYIKGKPKFDSHKIGKWTYFFEDEDYDRVSELCRKAVEEGVVLEAKHNNINNNKGMYDKRVSCFYP